MLVAAVSMLHEAWRASLPVLSLPYGLDRCCDAWSNLKSAAIYCYFQSSISLNKYQNNNPEALQKEYAATWQKRGCLTLPGERPVVKMEAEVWVDAFFFS